MTSSDIKVYRYLLGLIAVQLDFGKWPHMSLKNQGFRLLELHMKFLCMFYLNIKEEIQIKNSEQQLAATLVLNLFEFSVSSYSFGGNYSFLNLEIQG